MTRPELFVFIALSVGWVSIGAWAVRIAVKVNRLSDAMAGPGATPTREGPR